MNIGVAGMRKKFSWALCLLLATAMLAVCSSPAASANTMVSDARFSVLRVLCGSSTGTAFVIAQDGQTTYLVTNMHVIEEEPSEIYIIPYNIEEELIPAQVVHYRHGLDLVILATESGLEERPVLPLVPTSSVNFADTVYAIGFPGAADEVIDDWNLLLSSADDVTITMGTVGNPSKKMDNGISAIQSDVRISFGNSGGPLLNENAEVIGVNTWIYTEGAFGLSYSIHIDYIINMCIENGIPFVSDTATAPSDGYEIPTPEPGPPVPDKPPRSDDPVRPGLSEHPVSGFLYDNLGMIVVLGSIVVLAVLGLVIILTVTGNQAKQTAQPYYYGAQYAAYNTPQKRGFGAWIRRNKSAFAILVGGFVVFLIVGLILPLILTSVPQDNDRTDNAMRHTVAPGTPPPASPAPTVIPDATPPATPELTPQTTPPMSPSAAHPVSNRDVVGSWEFAEGKWLYHFGVSENIVFSSNGIVLSSENETIATWSINANGLLRVEHDDGTETLFTISKDGDTLIIEDSAGDISVYRNITGKFIDTWGFGSGDWIWVFGKSERVSFDDDFTVSLSETNAVTTWGFDDYAADVLIIWDPEYEQYRNFHLLVYGNDLLIIDEDGDVGRFERLS